MNIELHISTILHEKLPDLDKNPVADKWDLSNGTNIRNILEMLNLSEIPVILMLNGRQGSENDILREGDILKIFGVLAGG